MIPTITTFGWVPEFARGFVRDMRPRWAFEEVGQPYEVDLISDSKTPEHRRFQPFGQVPTYRDDEVAIFESGAINDIFEADRDWSKARHVKVVADLRTRLADLEAALGDKVWLDGNEFTI